MTAVEVFGQREDSGMALARAASSLMNNIRDLADLREAHELPEGECSVKVQGEWYGYAGLDDRGRMALWSAGDKGPSFYPPTEGETFVWRPLIGGVE